MNFYYKSSQQWFQNIKIIYQELKALSRKETVQIIQENMEQSCKVFFGNVKKYWVFSMHHKIYFWNGKRLSFKNYPKKMFVGFNCNIRGTDGVNYIFKTKQQFVGLYFKNKRKRQLYGQKVQKIYDFLKQNQQIQEMETTFLCKMLKDALPILPFSFRFTCCGDLKFTQKEVDEINKHFQVFWDKIKFGPQISEFNYFNMLQQLAVPLGQEIKKREGSSQNQTIFNTQYDELNFKLVLKNTKEYFVYKSATTGSQKSLQMQYFLNCRKQVFKILNPYYPELFPLSDSDNKKKYCHPSDLDLPQIQQPTNSTSMDEEESDVLNNHLLQMLDHQSESASRDLSDEDSESQLGLSARTEPKAKNNKKLKNNRAIKIRDQNEKQEVNNKQQNSVKVKKTKRIRKQDSQKPKINKKVQEYLQQLVKQGDKVDESERIILQDLEIPPIQIPNQEDQQRLQRNDWYFQKGFRG